jgi:hypothetical protein
LSTLEEVKTMQQQGMQEADIISSLQQKGTSYKDISDALSQSKIKAAVEQAPTDPSSPNLSQTQVQQAEPPSQYTEDLMPQSPNQSGQQSFQESQNPPMQNTQEMQGMQQSIMQSNPAQEQAMPQYEESYADPSGGYGYDQSQYDYAPTSISPDTITEISEQIVSERMMEIRKKLEEVTNLKTTFETKSESLDNRLNRIEKIIDDLQSSILKKVGIYMTNVSDIKKELIETQKSFKKINHHKTRKNSTHKKTRKK